jgi:tetratricopeptide (TPR) repeat protein
VNRRLRLIAPVLLITLVAAVYVTFATERTFANFGFRALGLFWISFSGCCLLAWFWLIAVPRISHRLAFGNPILQRRIVACVVHSPFPPAAKVTARFVLAACDQAANRHAQAEVLYRAILGDNAGRTVPEFESIVRQRLGETLDALGRAEAAQAEYTRAAAALNRSPETVLTLHTKAKLLEREHRYADAYSAYERAYALATPKEQAKGFELMARLSRCAMRSGRAADSLRWANAVLDRDPKGPFSAPAAMLAANAAVSLGKLQDAERYARGAADLSRTGQQRADALALVANYEMRRGNLDDAERTARAAAELAAGEQRLPWATLANIAAQRGCFDDAIKAVARAAKILEDQPQAAQRRELASIQLMTALYHAELGQGDLALRLLREAEPGHAGDGKEMVTYHLIAALVYALAQEREPALAQIAAAERGRMKFLNDGATQRAAFLHLGRAALLIDDAERAQSWLRSYLDLNPDPMYLPCAYYLLAECCRLVRNASEAKELYARAASTRMGTRWESLALERLAAFDASGRPRERA